MSPLPNDDRRRLLELARRAVIEVVQHGRLFVPPASPLEIERSWGVFVTLRRRGRLRGCIGQLETTDPLSHVVAHCAISAARNDPRFAPVIVTELAELEFEISLLSPLTRVGADQIEVGRHGIVVSRGRQRGLLLPQVAVEYRWTRERFLAETCVKGGMDRDAWKESGARIEVFTAEVISEAELNAASSPESSAAVLNTEKKAS